MGLPTLGMTLKFKGVYGMMLSITGKFDAGHNTDTFSMGSLRSELQLPAQFASTGSIEEEDDEDEDIMLMGTTPQVIATSCLRTLAVLWCSMFLTT